MIFRAFVVVFSIHFVLLKNVRQRGRGGRLSVRTGLLLPRWRQVLPAKALLHLLLLPALAYLLPVLIVLVLDLPLPRRCVRLPVGAREWDTTISMRSQYLLVHRASRLVFRCSGLPAVQVPLGLPGEYVSGAAGRVDSRTAVSVVADLQFSLTVLMFLD